MLKRFKTFKVLDRLSLKPLLSYSSKHFPLIRLSDLTSMELPQTCWRSGNQLQPCFVARSNNSEYQIPGRDAPSRQNSPQDTIRA